MGVVLTVKQRTIRYGKLMFDLILIAEKWDKYYGWNFK